jgi:hypothetical protein
MFHITVNIADFRVPVLQNRLSMDFDHRQYTVGIPNPLQQSTIIHHFYPHMFDS